MIDGVCEDRTPTRVLEVGAGCGYQAAVLAQFVREVHSIERIRGLYELAREHLRALRLTTRIRLIYGDGTLGLPGVAPGLEPAPGADRTHWRGQLETN
ncbi:hypothetical protein G6F55_014241 [Rhizopus delemar]|nr:hypothetical protein G6F55_014241 [Rhizopus delemar]